MAQAASRPEPLRTHTVVRQGDLRNNQAARGDVSTVRREKGKPMKKAIATAAAAGLLVLGLGMSAQAVGDSEVAWCTPATKCELPY